ncbi:DUF523 domain-containing protein [Roseicyclus marinus]|uniref:DUF523 domain-containing protein n=1 Tax=Roseicyclus marinus TaxID=2161673 RepID=UPI0024103780|nr:DUF523 domain-containing protein [Roseicyclus marinus]MDG3041696.1 DUF523 domain-containing protein [Roseicyclus marinus]
MERILVSACLLGQPVRYDGRGKGVASDILARWRAEGRLVAICPELAGGFGVPRPPAEIAPGAAGAGVLAGDGVIRDSGGQDVTAGFLAGAHAAVRLARAEGCRFALLTEGSPSCGVERVHGGYFDGRTRAGEGVVTAALRQAGLEVFPQNRIAELARAVDALENRPNPPRS